MTEWRGGNALRIRISHVSCLARHRPCLPHYMELYTDRLVCLFESCRYLVTTFEPGAIYRCFARHLSPRPYRRKDCDLSWKHLLHIQELDVYFPDFDILGLDRFSSLSLPLLHLNVLHSLNFRQPHNCTTFPLPTSFGLLGFLLDFGPCRWPESLTSLRLWGPHSSSDTRMDLFFQTCCAGCPFLLNYDSVQASSKKLATLHLLPWLQYHYGTFAIYAYENFVRCMYLLVHLSVPHFSWLPNQCHFYRVRQGTLPYG
jgi:hypothetical protein